MGWELKKQRFDVHQAEGLELQRKGLLNRAVVCFTKALSYKEDVQALLARSKCYVLIGKPELALSDAESVILMENSENYDVKRYGAHKGLLQKAEALYARGDFEDALLCYHGGYSQRGDISGFKDGIKKAESAIFSSIKPTSTAAPFSSRESTVFFDLADDSPKAAASRTIDQDGSVDLFGIAAGLPQQSAPDVVRRSIVCPTPNAVPTLLEDALPEFKTDIQLLRSLLSDSAFDNSKNINNILDPYTERNNNNNPCNMYIYSVGPRRPRARRQSLPSPPATPVPPYYGRCSAERAQQKKMATYKRKITEQQQRQQQPQQLKQPVHGQKRHCSKYRRYKEGLVSEEENNKMRAALNETMEYLVERKKFWVQGKRTEDVEREKPSPMPHLRTMLNFARPTKTMALRHKETRRVNRLRKAHMRPVKNGNQNTVLTVDADAIRSKGGVLEEGLRHTKSPKASTPAPTPTPIAAYHSTTLPFTPAPPRSVTPDCCVMEYNIITPKVPCEEDMIHGSFWAAGKGPRGLARDNECERNDSMNIPPRPASAAMRRSSRSPVPTLPARAQSALGMSSLRREQLHTNVAEEPKYNENEFPADSSTDDGEDLPVCGSMGAVQYGEQAEPLVTSTLEAIYSCIQCADLHSAVSLARNLLSSLTNVVMKGSTKLKTDLYDLIGTSYIHLKDYQQARVYFTKQLVLAKKYGDTDAYERAVSQLSAAYQYGDRHVLLPTFPVDLSGETRRHLMMVRNVMAAVATSALSLLVCVC